ncbi:YlcI/YnfO family protein [Burkholderia sp. BCC1977]|uniref:YlcI/YnfO family protein n=1 Tax=Burkholderia sp. BCC1977 TaxID=2817440 RepID=UPI0039F1F1F6
MGDGGGRASARRIPGHSVELHAIRACELMHRNCDAKEVTMKTATFPSVRVEPELRDAAENVLEEGETLSSFVEQSIREGIERRRLQSEFIARGIASRDEARRTGEYVSSADVLERLGRRLDTLRDRKRQTR